MSTISRLILTTSVMLNIVSLLLITTLSAPMLRDYVIQHQRPSDFIVVGCVGGFIGIVLFWISGKL